LVFMTNPTTPLPDWAAEVHTAYLARRTYEAEIRRIRAKAARERLAAWRALRPY